MPPLIALTLAFTFTSANAAPNSAKHAKISLDVTAKGETVTACIDQTSPDQGKNPRPVLKFKAGEPIKSQ